ncbi:MULTISPECIES: BTAD domain-containing putative transcriptional regulator [unclassified Micromonospora]|uniref:BTAD domain-containing putative transcriptional regulator n=1 Tax=unclassified Micromonospora TaxID=2617518 RepID=UPI001C5EA2F6|nr:BTAD domain-containing putative transcriptional regulator [Micromonospora sp. RL09-050-HVF-A]MBW4704682.1 tetratricopeptide repeat protein [Micromonospora sp. RL09-050-HVF-A]
MADSGGEIRRRRLGAGLTQEQLAERAGISVRAVRDIEQGRVRNPRAESLRRIAAAVGPPQLKPPGPAPPVATPAPTLRIDVLGPLRIQVGVEPVTLGSNRQRMLLGLLALHPDAIVSRHEIVDVLWGHDPPDSCLNLVHTYVARLRRVLDQPGGPAATITHVGGGYRLRVDPAQLDLSRFAAAIERAEGSVAGDLPSLDRLAGALALWRGPVLADAAPSLTQHPTAAALNRRRIATAVTYATLAVDLGLPDRAVRELHAVASHEPLHEQVHARLMLALAACGQQARALALHRNLRDRLAEQLGVEPGPELREAQLRILRQDLPRMVTHPGGPVTGTVPAPRLTEVAPRRPEVAQPTPPSRHRSPAQLPPDVAYFTGRSTQLAALDALLVGATAARGPVVISTITGMAGVGKTALAVHWAHRVRRHFPDGQLYVNLRGYSTASPVRESEALAGFLHALGVPADQVPVDPGQAAALFRTMLDGRRMLVMLDNAASADQVRPLLPGAAGCLALVTSRDRLSGLVAVDGARRLDLDVLTVDEAGTLLTRIIPPDRVARSGEIAELATVCARLPLALRIAAANLIDQPQQSISAHTARLTAGNQLAGLRVEGDDQAAVRAAFDLSYAALPAPARRLFRLLGTAPGTDVTVTAAAALAGIGEPTAAHELDRLAAAHLVQQVTPGRYAFHDLLRLYALERATAEDPAGQLRSAIRRLYGWYRQRTDAAAATIYPHLVRLPPDGAEPHPGGSPFPSSAGAMAWLEEEHTNLMRVIAHAAENGADPAAWRIPDALRGYYQFRPHSDGLVAATSALHAAQQVGDHAGEAASRLGLASLHLRRGEYAVGLSHATAMIDAAHRAAWPEGLAAAYGTCGLLHLRAGRLAEGAELTRLAVSIHERLGGPERLSTSLGNLGVIYRDMGRLREAAEVFRQSLALTRSTGMWMSAGISLSNLGEVQHALGQHGEALDHLREALDLSRRTGYRPTETESLRRLAALRVQTGDLGPATKLADEALALADLIGDTAQQAAARNVRGAIHQRNGDPAAAIEHRRALELARAGGARGEEVEALIGLAEVFGDTDPTEAVALARQARTVARAAGYRVWEGHALVAAAEAMRNTDPVTSARTAEEALATHRETGHLLGQVRALRLLVALGPAGGVDAAQQSAYRREITELSRRVRPVVDEDLPVSP